jgi:hypothetical protein
VGQRVIRPILTHWRHFVFGALLVISGCKKTSVPSEPKEANEVKEAAEPGAQCRGPVPPIAPREHAGLVWPKSGFVTLTVHGTFSNQAPDSQNWMSPPPTQRRPPPLDVKPAWLDALSCAFTPSLHASLSAAGLRTNRTAADGQFGVDVYVGGSDEVGGHHGGLTIRMEATSGAKPRDVVRGTSRVELPTSGDDAPAALATALDKAIRDAFADLHRTLDDDAKKPVAEMTLVFETDNLTADQRTEIDGLARCAIGLGTSLDSEKIADGKWRVRYRLKKWEPNETEEQYVEKFASWLGEICDHGKCRCSTWRSKLDGMTSERRVDVAQKTVFVRLRHR